MREWVGIGRGLGTGCEGGREDKELAVSVRKGV